MTTRAAHLPVGSIRIAFGTTATIFVIAVLAALTAMVLLLARGGNSEVSLYETGLAPVIERHNAAVASWNGFVDEHNASAVFSLGGYDAQAAAARVQVDAIAAEMEATVAQWASIVPPVSRAEPHALVLQAMQLTVEGVTGISAYFDAAVTGEGDYAQARLSLAIIDKATAYWAQAKSFEG
ncbi:MAG: hypothetical protein O3C10_04805 [Chloroflexi bacterium]|nr:hypothetical protein [Chloroflexota bacterium]